MRSERFSSRLTSTWITSPSRCNRPWARRIVAPRAAERNLRHTSGRMIRLAWPVSSSSVTNVMPFAVPGRWRTSTIPATRTGLPLGQVFSCDGRDHAQPLQPVAQELHRMGPQRQARGAVVGQDFLGGRHEGEGDGRMMNDE